MNFKEGMRRIGLVLGVFGALCGGLFSCVVAMEKWDWYQENLQFNRLVQTPTLNKFARSLREETVKMQEYRSKRVMVQKDGVEEVFVDDSGAIESITTPNGKKVTNRNIRYEDLVFAAIVPPVGFLVPWASIKLLMWVVGGFSKTQQTR